MINQYNSSQEELELTSDLAGEFPLYLYWPEDRSALLYSDSIDELLNDARVPKPLKVSNEGISFLLQSGHEFPFMNASRLNEGEMQPDKDLILQMLADATINRIDKSKPSFLFHSAGKDSNSVALALAEAGWQDRVTLITHKSKGSADESEISARIAKKLGFRHQILHEIDYLRGEHKKTIEDYFKNAPFPCTDNVTLAYPLYAQQLPELKGANIIDGGGNDSYMSTPPTRKEKKIIPLSGISHRASFMRYLIRSESLLTPLIRTPAECFGMSGLSLADSKKILPSTLNVYSYWKRQSLLRKGWDLFDFKTSILTPIVASELHIRKARNFSDSLNSNLILPFSSQPLAEYFSRMPEKYLFDRNDLRNKLTLRKLLKDKINLDSDALGKLGFSYDSKAIVSQNWSWITDEMLKCKLWDKAEITKLCNRLNKVAKSNHKYSNLAACLIYRVYLLSAWYNKNRYING